MAVLLYADDHIVVGDHRDLGLKDERKNRAAKSEETGRYATVTVVKLEKSGELCAVEFHLSYSMLSGRRR
tara:strand:+ start:153 stop:362 length:210 start_codon:yes stop_codon:yes gene_type:complete